MSSGVTKSRPSRAARALLPASSIAPGARARPEHQRRARARRAEQAHDVGRQVLAHLDLGRARAQRADLRGPRDSAHAELARRRARPPPVGRGRGCAPRRRPRGSRSASLKRKRSSCASGNGIGALVLDRVHRREHGERLGQGVARAVDGHAPLLHRLEQRRLGLGRRAVDLVAQEHVREDRPGAEDELARGRGGRRSCRSRRPASGRA